jgi:hypothetical protein
VITYAELVRNQLSESAANSKIEQAEVSHDDPGKRQQPESFDSDPMHENRHGEYRCRRWQQLAHHIPDSATGQQAAAGQIRQYGPSTHVKIGASASSAMAFVSTARESN